MKRRVFDDVFNDESDANLTLLSDIRMLLLIDLLQAYPDNDDRSELFNNFLQRRTKVVEV